MRRKSNIPTSDKDTRRHSQVSPLPLATPNGKAPISVPKAMRKKRKRKQGKDMEVRKDLWHR